LQNSRNAVVIGSGFGGLAAAIRLQAMGFQTTILEKRSQPGGRAAQIRDKGYVFDAGPSLITAPSILDAVFRAGGTTLAQRLPMVRLDPFYTVHFHDGTSFRYSGDPEAMKAQMRRFSPHDADHYERFMADAKPIHQAVIADGLGGSPFDSLLDMLRFLPKAIRLKAVLPLHFNVSRYFRDFRHRFLFSFHPLFIGGNPFTAPSIYMMISYLERSEGVWFSPGGMHSLVQAFADLFGEMGGTILCDHEAERIEVRDGRAVSVRAAGRDFPADLVARKVIGAERGRLRHRSSAMALGRIVSLLFRICRTLVAHGELDPPYATPADCGFSSRWRLPRHTDGETR